MAVGWFAPASLEFPDSGTARIRVALLGPDNRASAEWVRIDDANSARQIAQALRDQAQFGIASLQERLGFLEGSGRIEVDASGALSGTIERPDEEARTVSGRIDLQARSAPPAGVLEGHFVLLGSERDDSFHTYRMAAEVPEPAPEPAL